MNWYKLSQLAQEEYRIPHTAPDKDSSPMHNLINTYPEDIYSSKGAQYFGHYGQNDPKDIQAISVIQSAKNKPNKPIRIYRAVPNINKAIETKIKELSALIWYFDTYKFFPVNNPIIRKIGDKYPNEQYTGHKYDEKQQLIYQDILKNIEQLNLKKEKPITINPEDWVTINRDYAKEHGEASLGGNYKVISKVVPASTLYTEGDSIQEWGYNP